MNEITKEPETLDQENAVVNEFKTQIKELFKAMGLEKCGMFPAYAMIEYLYDTYDSTDVFEVIKEVQQGYKGEQHDRRNTN